MKRWPFLLPKERRHSAAGRVEDKDLDEGGMTYFSFKNQQSSFNNRQSILCEKVIN